MLRTKICPGSAGHLQFRFEGSPLDRRGTVFSGNDKDRSLRLVSSMAWRFMPPEILLASNPARPTEVCFLLCKPLVLVVVGRYHMEMSHWRVCAEAEKMPPPVLVVTCRYQTAMPHWWVCADSWGEDASFGPTVLVIACRHQTATPYWRVTDGWVSAHG